MIFLSIVNIKVILIFLSIVNIKVILIYLPVVNMKLILILFYYNFPVYCEHEIDSDFILF